MKQHFEFRYTDLSEDSGQPWFATHFNFGIAKNGNWKVEIRRMTESLRFWRLRLIFAYLRGAI